MRWPLPSPALLVLLALLPAAAQALSCLPPNPARELDDGLRRGANAQVLVGELTTPFDNDEGRYRFEGRLFGRGVTIDRLSSGVDVSATCVAEWCGELPRRPVDGLFIVAGTRQGLKLTLGPCGGGQYAKPGPDQLRALERCVEAGGCSPAEIEAFAAP